MEKMTIMFDAETLEVLCILVNGLSVFNCLPNVFTGRLKLVETKAHNAKEIQEIIDVLTK